MRSIAEIKADLEAMRPYNGTVPGARRISELRLELEAAGGGRLPLDIPSAPEPSNPLWNRSDGDGGPHCDGCGYPVPPGASLCLDCQAVREDRKVDAMIEEYLDWDGGTP